jgi:hypothetical protein
LLAAFSFLILKNSLFYSSPFIFPFLRYFPLLLPYDQTTQLLNFLSCFIVCFLFKYSHLLCAVAVAMIGRDYYGSQEGWTALIWAAWNGHADCVRLLINVGADKDAKSIVRHRSLLYFCAFATCFPFPVLIFV